MALLFDDRYRWTKFGGAILLLAALCVTCGIVVPLIRPSVFYYETRADEYEGRTFALCYKRVKETHAGYFTIRTTPGEGLRFTDQRRRRDVEGAAISPVTDAATVCGLTVRPGDTVSVKGEFRKPNLMVLREVRQHPLRGWKYGTSVPALLVVGWFAWRRLRLTRRGLVASSDE